MISEGRIWTLSEYMWDDVTTRSVVEHLFSILPDFYEIGVFTRLTHLMLRSMIAEPDRISI